MPEIDMTNCRECPFYDQPEVCDECQTWSRRNHRVICMDHSDVDATEYGYNNIESY